MKADDHLALVSNQPAGVEIKFLVSAVAVRIKVKPHWHEFAEFEENRRIVDHEVKGGPNKREYLTFALGTSG